MGLRAVFRGKTLTTKEVGKRKSNTHQRRGVFAVVLTTLLTLSIAIALAGCGSDGGNSGGTTNNPGQAAQPQQPAGDNWDGLIVGWGKFDSMSNTPPDWNDPQQTKPSVSYVVVNADKYLSYLEKTYTESTKGGYQGGELTFEMRASDANKLKNGNLQFKFSASQINDIMALIPPSMTISCGEYVIVDGDSGGKAPYVFYNTVTGKFIGYDAYRASR